MKRTLALILVAVMAFAAVVCWGGNGIVAHADDPQFSANVIVGLVGKDSGDLYYGDTVQLYASIDNANMPYNIIWQANAGEGWKTIQEGGLRYEMELTSSTVSRSYRVVLEAVEPAE